MLFSKKCETRDALTRTGEGSPSGGSKGREGPGIRWRHEVPQSLVHLCVA